MPGNCFCEAIRGGFVGQPANTWSSFGFVVIGLVVLAMSSRKNSEFRRVHRIVFGVALIAIGLGSAFYHASLTFLGQLFDVQGMYLFAIFVLLYGLARRSLVSDRTFVPLYVLINLVFLGLQIALPGIRRYLFAALLLSVILIEMRKSAARPLPRKYFYVALGTMAVAFLIWILDITRIACRPESLIQGHAIWHILGAVAAFALFRYYTQRTLTPIDLK